MESLKIDIDGVALKQFLEDTGRTKQGLSREIGCGNGYMSNAIITNRMGRPQYMLMCRVLGVDEDRFKQKPIESDEAVAEKGTFKEQVPDPEIGEILKRIEKDIVRLAQIMLDIQELLRR